MTWETRRGGEASDDRAKRRALELLGTLARDLTPEGMGYAVLLFDLGPGATWYISNVDRTDVAAALKAWIAEQETHST